MNRSRSGRRDFLKRATGFSAAIAAPYFWTSSTLRAESKNDRLNVAAIGASIYTEPPVLILDEPTVGLDPRQISEIRGLIRKLGGEQTVILSTHILPEVTMTCSRVVIINEGQIIAQDSIENLTTGLETSETVLLRVARDTDGLDRTLTALPAVAGVSRPEPGVYLVRAERSAQGREVIASTVVQAGAGLLELSRQTASLEEVFLQLVTDESEEEAS